MSHKPAERPAQAAPSLSGLRAAAERAGAYARQGASILATMGRFAARGDAMRVRDGGRALSALARAIAAGARGERECPVCGWTGERFGPVYYVDCYREDARCYGCGALERYRALAAFLRDGMPGFFDTRRRVLDIAPTRRSRDFFPKNIDYVSFDLCSPHAMIHGDLTSAPFSTEAFDLWLCFHVLDAVPDDAAAMRELWRVLAPGGVGVLDNAMCWDRPTEEYGAARPDESHHVRRYGNDLPEKLARAGFDVEIADLGERFDERSRGRYGFGSRRILLCRKPAR